MISARKTARLVEQLRQAEWKPSNKTDAEWECEFLYPPEGWKKAYRFVALRYEKTREEMKAEEFEQLGIHFTQLTPTGCVCSCRFSDRRTNVSYVVGAVFTACCTNRKNSLPRLFDVRRLKRNVNSSR